MRRLIAFVLVIGILFFIGCSIESEAYNEGAFELISKENLAGSADDKLIVVRHKETGKRFVIYQGYKKGGIQPLD